MKKTVLYFFLLSLLFSNLSAQKFQEQKNQVFTINILSNGLMAGVGGLVNKSKKDKSFKTFAKNFGKGCLGGLVKYSAKSQAHYLSYPQFSFLAPFNRLYYFIGHSMVMNASENKNIFDTYYVNFYGVDMKIKTAREVKKRIDARLSLATTASVGYYLLKKNKLDFYKTLEYGVFYFNFDSTYQARVSGSDFMVTGQASVNAIVISRSNSRVRTSLQNDDNIPHELIHVYQFYDFFPLVSFYEKPLKKLYSDCEWHKKLSKVFNLDYAVVFYGLSYVIQPEEPTHYANYHEFEAQHFGSRKYVRRFSD
jgi:hypothetical protein